MPHRYFTDEVCNGRPAPTPTTWLTLCAPKLVRT